MAVRAGIVAAAETAVEMRARQIPVMQSGIGGLILINLVISFALPGISCPAHADLHVGKSAWVGGAPHLHCRAPGAVDGERAGRDQAGAARAGIPALVEAARGEAFEAVHHQMDGPSALGAMDVRHTCRRPATRRMQRNFA